MMNSDLDATPEYHTEQAEVGANPELPVIRPQFSLLAIFAFITLTAVYLAFMTTHGLKSIPIGGIGLGFLASAFFTARHGVRMILQSTAFAAFAGGATMPLAAPLGAFLQGSLFLLIVNVLFGIGFGALCGGVMSCFTEIGAHVIVLRRQNVLPINHREDFESIDLSGRRRLVAWVLSVVWLAIWNWGWV